LLEQSPISFDKLIIGDLAAAYAAQLDAQVIAGAGTGGVLKGILAATGTTVVTYTDASPTAAKLYSKVAGAIATIHTSRFLPPTHIFMHPRRWAYLLASVDSTGRPLVVPSANAPMNVVGVAGAVASENFVGSFCGLPVFVDANIPANLGAGTNQDVVIIARASDSVLYEGTAKAEAMAQTYGANLQVLIRMYNYAAFTAERMAQSVAIVGGNGLVTPSF
jgi:HK97 family phage major capsid protein